MEAVELVITDVEDEINNLCDNCNTIHDDTHDCLNHIEIGISGTKDLQDNTMRINEFYRTVECLKPTANKYKDTAMERHKLNYELYEEFKNVRKTQLNCCGKRIPLCSCCIISIRDVQGMELFVKKFIDHPRGVILMADIMTLGRRIQHERNFFFKLYFLFTFLILGMATLLTALSQLDNDTSRLTMLILGVFLTVMKGIMETFSLNANYEIAKKKLAVYRQLTWNFLTQSVFYDTEEYYRNFNKFRTTLYGRLRDFDDENVSPAMGERSGGDS